GFILGQHFVELAHQRKAQRIELVGAVQRDDRDIVEALGQDEFIGHVRLSVVAGRGLTLRGGGRLLNRGTRFLGARMGGAVEGVRVLELARYQAGPRGGMILSDLGAEVIKIEKLGGEETRRSEPLVRGQSVYFSVYNRGKKSLCVDLRNARGKQVFAALVPTADIVLENFRPGTMAQMGFGYDRLRE